MPVNFLPLLILIIAFLTSSALAVPPPQTPDSLSFFLPESDQTCIMVGCPNPYQEGAQFCRSLNRGCIFCAPHPRSIPPLVTFACVGEWSQTQPLELEGGYLRPVNGSRHISALAKTSGGEES